MSLPAAETIVAGAAGPDGDISLGSDDPGRTLLALADAQRAPVIEAVARMWRDGGGFPVIS